MIAAIVINYKSEEKTIAFVREELSKISAPHEVVVVDNGSTAESAAALRKGLPEGCKVLEMKGNAGFARGNNAGAALFPEADFYLFANNDIVFTSSSVVDDMAARLSGLPDFGVIGPRVTGTDGKQQSPHPYRTFWHRHVAIYWSNLFMSKAKHKARFETVPDSPEGPCYLVSGCFFMARGEDFRACGGMDPATFLYAEEAILAERMKSIGRGEWYLPSVSVLHEHEATTARYFDALKRRQMAFESDCYYYRHYMGTPAWQIAFAKFTYFLKKLFRR
ncbi:MAG: glycosyltransferase family 2 protein [Bacteroidales bacterium]|nr:glycosyltransferase family 2 protein [Bacteroidales bacterium]